MIPGPAFRMIYGSSGACTDCDFKLNSGSSFVTHAAAGVCTRCRWGGYAVFYRTKRERRIACMGGHQATVLLPLRWPARKHLQSGSCHPSYIIASHLPRSVLVYRGTSMITCYTILVGGSNGDLGLLELIDGRSYKL